MQVSVGPVRETASMLRPADAPVITQQALVGASFNARQGRWRGRIADVVAASAGVTAEDLDNAPFTERGGVDGAIRDLGSEAATYLAQLDGS
jgi:type I restriction enzyme R subunit